ELHYRLRQWLRVFPGIKHRALAHGQPTAACALPTKILHPMSQSPRLAGQPPTPFTHLRAFAALFPGLCIQTIPFSPLFRGDSAVEVPVHVVRIWQAVESPAQRSDLRTQASFAFAQTVH